MMTTEPGSASFRAADVATACGGRLVGDGDQLVSGVRALHAAAETHLSFAADAAAERKAVQSKAGVLLVKSAAAFAGRTVVEVADPAAALAEVLRLFHPVRVARGGIHPTAVVDPSTSVDPTAEIGPFAVIGAHSRVEAGAIVEAHVVVGSRCRVGALAWLHPHVVLYDDVALGERVEAHSGVVLGADGFGYATTKTGIKKIPQVGGVLIEADVEIGANSCIDRASLETTVVGAGTKIDDLVMVGHNCVIGRHGFLCGQAGLAGSTTLGDGVVLGGQVGVAGHLRIGNGVKAGAQTGVNEDVPDGAAIFGSPHMPYRDAMKTIIELKRLAQTARLVRRLAEKAGLDADEGSR